MIGARQVSWLAAYRRRCLPGRSAQWRRCVGTPLTVAGAAADRPKACRVPFSPSKTRGTVRILCSSLASGCQMTARP